MVHVESLTRLYGQCSTYKAALDTLYTDMAEYYKADKGFPVHCPVVGGCYVVQFVQDNEWYRAKVLSVKDQVEIEVRVHYLLMTIIVLHLGFREDGWSSHKY